MLQFLYLIFLFSLTLQQNCNQLSEKCSANQKIPLVFYSDGSNFDDVITLQILSKSDQINLLLVAINGNGWGNLAPSARNFFNILDAYGRCDVPIITGATSALIDRNILQNKYIPQIPTLHSYKYKQRIPHALLDNSDSLMGVGHLLPQSLRGFNPKKQLKDASTFKEILKNQNNQVTILSTGTLTGLADFINSFDDETELNEYIQKINSIIVMGGAVDNEPGNIFTSPYNNSTQEYNIFLDPEATNIVFKTFGTKVILVPLKAINYVPITRQWFDQFQKLSGTAEIEWTQKFYRELKDLWHEDENIFFQEAYVWDAVASIVITNPEVILDIKVDLVYVQESSDPNFHDPILIEPDVGKVIVNPENGQGYPINIIRKLDGLKINDILMHKLSQKYFETSRCPDNQPSNFLQF